MRVICFGDSNTFGYDPRSYTGGRYDAASRWVDLLASETGWEIRNNSMNGREIPRREMVFSQSADLLIIMLGTNDLLQGNSVDVVTARMERFLNSLKTERKRVLLLAPPPMTYGEWVRDQSLIAASAALGESYRSLSETLGIHFADTGEWRIPLTFDGVHFSETGHRIFAKKLLSVIQSTIN